MNLSGDSHTIAPPRTATISRNDAEPIGVCIFIDTAELRELGVNPVDVEAISYRLIQVNGQPVLGIKESSLPADASPGDSITD